MTTVAAPAAGAQLPAEEIARHGAAFFAALCSACPMPPLSERHPELGIDAAYAISLDFLARRLATGERVVGKKIGLTAKAVQDALGVYQPDFGFLTDRMAVSGEVDIAAHRLIQARIEAEIAFILARDLAGTEITAEDVLAATEFVAPCFEIVDSRVEDWRIGIVDTVADNASCGLFALGAARVDPRALDLAALRCTVTKNGAPLSEGTGAAVQGSPLNAVAWLANTLGAYGESLKAGEIILSGSLVPLAPVAPGDTFETTIDAIGTCSVRFI